MLGWNCFSSLMSLTFELNSGSTSLRITRDDILKRGGLWSGPGGRAGVLEGLAVLAPGGELS